MPVIRHIPAPTASAPATGSGDVTLTAAEIAEELLITVDRAAALLDFARARLQAYAPGAPVAAKTVAAWRYIGYLAEAEFGAVESDNVGPTTVNYVTNHAAAWRNSGAAGCVAPWRIRRAGAIG